MREPSLHIKESDLLTVLLEVLPKTFLLSKDKNKAKRVISNLASELVEKGKVYSCNSRSIKITNEKLNKKVEKLKLAGRSNASIFAQILLHHRRKLKHRGIAMIKVGDKDWLDLKEICGLATDFCNEFGIGIKEGYTEYISIGLSKMKNYSIFKFKGLHSAICSHYEASVELVKDNKPEKTKELHDIYMTFISDKIGFSKGYEGMPEKYIYFVRAREEAEKMGVSYKVYIAAQFESMDWRSGIPDPAQLVGDKAFLRLQSYAFTHNVKLGDKKKFVDYSSIKKKRNERKGKNSSTK